MKGLLPGTTADGHITGGQSGPEPHGRPGGNSRASGDEGALRRVAVRAGGGGREDGAKGILGGLPVGCRKTGDCGAVHRVHIGKVAPELQVARRRRAAYHGLVALWAAQPGTFGWWCRGGQWPYLDRRSYLSRCGGGHCLLLASREA